MYKVLLVDDEPWALSGIKNSFDWITHGFEVVADTTNPLEAQELIRIKRPDVVFTDIRMPQVSGIDLIKVTRQEGIDAEFIVVSGYAEFDYAQKALRLGAYDYRLKPIKIEESDELLIRLFKHLTTKSINKKLKIVDIEYMSDSDKMNPSLNEILEFVNNHYNQELYLKEICEKFHINLTYCCDLFKKHIGSTFTEYVTNLRIKKACELLKDTQLPIKKIAEVVGYNDYCYFYKVFKKIIKITPALYRKEVE
jgi:two-component system, response regulator YesN